MTPLHADAPIGPAALPACIGDRPGTWKDGGLRRDTGGGNPRPVADNLALRFIPAVRGTLDIDHGIFASRGLRCTAPCTRKECVLDVSGSTTTLLSVHPRVYGEHFSANPADPTYLGSSPRVRRTRTDSTA